jgi:hypothetical protein
MFCHRLLRPIADIRTVVAEGTDSNVMINRGPRRRRTSAPIAPIGAAACLADLGCAAEQIRRLGRVRRTEGS